MKKLNLEKLKLAAEDVLQRNQMGTIYGGSGGSSSGSHVLFCENGYHWDGFGECPTGSSICDGYGGIRECFYYP